MKEQTTAEFMKEHEEFMDEHKRERKEHIADMKQSLIDARALRREQQAQLKKYKKENVEPFLIEFMEDLIASSTRSINSLKKYVSGR